MSQHTSRRLAAFGLFAVLCSAVHAQPTNYDGFARYATWPSNAAASKIATARLAATGHTDVIALIGTELYLAYDPMDHETYERLGGDVLDFVVVPDPGGSLDALITIEDDGPHLWTLHTGSLLRDPSTIGSVAWGSARMARPAAWAAGGSGVIAVDGAQGDVVGLEFDGTGWVERSRLPAGAVSAQTVRRTPGVVEVVARTPNSIEVLTSAGVSVASYPFVDTPNLIATVPPVDGRGGRILWVAGSGTTTLLVEIDSTGIAGVLDLGDTPVDAIHVANYDDDQWPDVLLFREGDAYVFLDTAGDSGRMPSYERTYEGVIHFPLTDSETGGTFGPTGLEAVATADLDDDGDRELLIAGTGDSQQLEPGLWVFTGTAYREWEDGQRIVIEREHSVFRTVGGDRKSVDLEIDVQIPPSAQRIPATATHVAFAIWEQEAHPGTLEPDSILHTIAPIQMSSSSYTVAGVDVTIDLPLDYSTSTYVCKAVLVDLSHGVPTTLPDKWPNAPSSISIYTPTSEMLVTIQSWRGVLPGAAIGAPIPDEGDGFSPRDRGFRGERPRNGG